MRTIIIYGEQGKGKTRNADLLKRYFGCAAVVDDWVSGDPLAKGDLALTNDDLALNMVSRRGVEVLSLDQALQEAGEANG